MSLPAPQARVVLCDESDEGFGWISREPDWMGRASHALLADGRVWLVDPVDFDGLDERIASLGEPAGVLQLLGWHHRDSEAVAARLGVPRLVTPGAVAGSPFETIPVTGPRGWQETALWWPATRTLVVAEAVGTVRYFCAPGRPLGVHPLLRIVSPPRALAGFEPGRILCSHGRGVEAGATEALREALARARRDLPRVIPRIVTAKRHRAV